MIYVIDIIKATHSSQGCVPIGTAETESRGPTQNSCQGVRGARFLRRCWAFDLAWIRRKQQQPGSTPEWKNRPSGAWTRAAQSDWGVVRLTRATSRRTLSERARLTERSHPLRPR